MDANHSASATRAPIRVLHVINDLDVGGAERMLARLISSSDPARVCHSVIALLPPGRTGDEIRATGCPVATLSMRRGAFGPGALPRLVRLLRADRPDVLQSWLYHADLMATLAAPLARVKATAWNIRCSELDFRLYPRATRWVVRALATLSRLPDAVVVNSEAGRAAHARLGYRPRRWELIPNGFDTSLFRPDPAARDSVRRELGIPADAPLIGMLARLDPMKDHATFLAAAARLAASRPDARFLLAGRGVELGSPALVPDRALAGRLHLLGERHDSPRLLAALDLATLASAFGEGFPNVLGEAMAAAVPCVATDVGDTALLVGPTGRVVPPREPSVLAEAWAALLALPAGERAALGAAARARIMGNYSLETACDHYLALYDSLRSSRERGIVRIVNARDGKARE